MLASVARESAFAFAPIRDATLMRLDYNTTILPPKKAFLPQEETLFTFQTDGGFSTQPIFDTQPRLLFGVHTCDIHAMKLLDAAFLSQAFAALNRDLNCMASKANACDKGLTGS